MKHLLDPAYIEQIARVATVMLAGSFIALILQGFRSTSQRRILWIAYWSLLLIQYLSSFTAHIFGKQEAVFFVDYVLLLDIAQSVVLLIIAETLPTPLAAESAPSLSQSVTRIVPIGTLVAGLSIANPILPYYPEAILGFLAVSWFVARWVTMEAPTPRMYFAIPLLAYAANFLYPFFDPQRTATPGHVVGSTIDWLAYVFLAYASYRSLEDKAPVSDHPHTTANVTSTHEEGAARDTSTRPAASRKAAAKNTKPPRKPTPPKIGPIHLKGLFGFLYLMWYYPSGKAWLFALVALLMTVVMSLLAILPKLLTSLK